MKTKLILDSEWPEYPSDLISEAPTSGRFDDYADWIVSEYEIESDPDMIRKYLKECGAWDQNELLDDDLNIKRFLWITILNQAEEIGENT